MKKIHFFTTLCSLSLSLPLAADTFVLKNGTKLEGKVLSQDATSFMVEVQVTRSIKEERKIQKADVASHEEVRLDAKAFEMIKPLVPTPDFISADEYPQKIAEVEKFLKAYPASKDSKEAKAILATLKQESTAISAGGVKSGGKVLSPEEYRSNAYELDARAAEMKIRNLIQKGSLLQALREFEDFDRDYRTTISYGALSPTILQVIRAYAADIDQSLATLDSRIKKRDGGLTQMTADDRRNTLSAIAEETAIMDARLKQEKADKFGWVSTGPFHKPSLDDASKFAQTELARIGAVKTVLGEDGGRAYREAWTVIHGGGKATAAATALAAARTAGVPARYLEPLEADAKSLK